MQGGAVSSGKVSCEIYRKSRFKRILQRLERKPFGDFSDLQLKQKMKYRQKRQNRSSCQQLWQLTYLCHHSRYLPPLACLTIESDA